MCEEYEDERLRAVWRVIAADEGLKVLPLADSDPEPAIQPTRLAPLEPAKPKPRALMR